MKWDCAGKGCYLEHAHPGIEVFSDALSGRRAFSDLDAITELRGRVFIVEWKLPGVALPEGQRIMAERLTLAMGGSIYVLAEGDVKDMRVRALRSCRAGRWAEKWTHATPSEPDLRPLLNDTIRAWEARTEPLEPAVAPEYHGLHSPAPPMLDQCPDCLLHFAAPGLWHCHGCGGHWSPEHEHCPTCQEDS